MTAAAAARPKLELTFDQSQALEAILAFWKKKDALMTLGGYAGTGKTTLIAQTVRVLEQKKRPVIAFCTFTGRASSVLRAKLEAAGAYDLGDYCGTIHGLIYKPVIRKGLVKEWRKADSIDQDLIVIDEASMVNKEIFDDLASYGKPILAVGDHGQLPPVAGKFNLMENPQVRLERIHRQAQGNPIIKLSIMAREGLPIPVGSYGEWVNKTSNRAVLDGVKDLSDVLILCGTNQTRVEKNAYMRKRLGINDPKPIVGDKVICLKNNREAGIYNGMSGLIESIKEDGEHWYDVKIEMEAGDSFSGKILRRQFGERQTLREVKGLHPRAIGDLFDWGYAMTVHKAQGSEARRVVLFEERMGMMTDEDWNRWRYTGITRASERLLIVGN